MSLCLVKNGIYKTIMMEGRNNTIFMTAGLNLSEKIKNYKDGITKKVPIGIKCFRAGDAWDRTSVVIVTKENQMEVSMFWNSLYFDNERDADLQTNKAHADYNSYQGGH